MNIFINGDSISLPAKSTLNNALAIYFSGKTQVTFALALNQVFIGKGSYSITLLQDNDSIDILLPIQGG